MNTGQRLGQVQYEGHLAIDREYQALAAAVAAIVMQYAVIGADGVARLPLFSRTQVLVEIGRRLDAVRPALLSAILDSVLAAEQAAMTSEGIDVPRDLSQSLAVVGTTWRALGTDRPSVLSQTGALLVKGIAAGLSAAGMAKRVSQYFSPWFATRRDATGGLVREGRQGAVRSWPGQAGMASAHARTVMLTETGAAHGRMVRRIAAQEGRGLRWRLSPQHAGSDECDGRAHADVGYGEGVYPLSEFPPLPAHPRCRCFSESVELRAR